jgi:hypothetical protein
LLGYGRGGADAPAWRFASNAPLISACNEANRRHSVARDCKILVPKDIENEVKIFVEATQAAAAQTKAFDADDIELIEPEFIQLSGVEIIETFVVYVASSVATDVSKEWFDSRVRPQLLTKIDRANAGFWNWYENKFKPNFHK